MSAARIHRYEHGVYLRETTLSGAPATLIFIHGLGESGLCFEALMKAPLLAGWGQLAPDLPGYGKSPWRAEPYSLEEHAEFLAAWIHREVPGAVVIIGHSMGGVIATLLCELLCERLAGLPGERRVAGFLNVEGNVSFEDCGFSSLAAAHPLERFLDGEYETLLDRLYRDGLEDKALRTYYPSARICDPRAYHKNSVELVRLSRAEGQAARQAALNVPHLYVLGSGGTGEYSRGLLDRAGVPWRQIDDAGHWPFLDQPADFLDVTLRFLASLEL